MLLNFDVPPYVAFQMLHVLVTVNILINPFACWIIFQTFVVVYLLFFQNLIFMNNLSVSNGLDQDQDQHYVGPDLGANCQVA